MPLQEIGKFADAVSLIGIGLWALFSQSKGADEQPAASNAPSDGIEEKRKKKSLLRGFGVTMLLLGLARFFSQVS